MGKNLLSFGLVVGLDYPEANLDAHELLQSLKRHPVLKGYLQGGHLMEWGAKTIPEGGYYAIPEVLHGEGVLTIGDAAGFVNVASLKGIHYAVLSGMLAAEAVSKAHKNDDFSSSSLSTYDQLIRQGEIVRDLYRTRNMRLAFKSGFFLGALKAESMAVTKGRFPGKRIATRSDADELKVVGPSQRGHVGLSKVDAVFQSGNKTRDDIPQHLIVPQDIPKEIAEFYVHLCPAGVYERVGELFVVNPANCIDCKATDVLGPRWMPREGGSGPRYRKM
jgi:electron-transferring-flavoprotein dehydrogenase